MGCVRLSKRSFVYIALLSSGLPEQSDAQLFLGCEGFQGKVETASLRSYELARSDPTTAIRNVSQNGVCRPSSFPPRLKGMATPHQCGQGAKFLAIHISHFDGVKQELDLVPGSCT